MALRRVSAFGGSWSLVPGLREAQIRPSLLRGIRRPCWTERCHPGSCGVGYGNEREGQFVLHLGHPIVDEL